MSEHIHYITDDTFESEVLQSPQPVLVDYWAEWCGPCKMIAPILDDIAKEYAGQAQHRREPGDARQVRHPRHPDPDDLQERQCRGNQGRRIVEIATRRFY